MAIRGAFFSSRFRVTSKYAWHQLLGLPHMDIVNYHLHNKNLTSIKSAKFENKLCNSYQLGKAFHLPFLPINSPCIEPFQVIHCNLWGPSPVASFQHFRCYAIFMDETAHYYSFSPVVLHSLIAL